MSAALSGALSFSTAEGWFARADELAAAGTIDQALWDALPPVPEETVAPTQEQAENAATLLGEQWAVAVG